MVKIENTIDFTMIHLFKSPSSTHLLCEKTIPKLKALIKECINAPKKDKKVYVARFSYKPDTKVPLKITLAPYFITETLNLITDYDNPALTIEYTKKELEEYGFKKGHIKKIIHAIENNEVSFNELTESISNIL